MSQTAASALERVLQRVHAIGTRARVEHMRAPAQVATATRPRAAALRRNCPAERGPAA
ncbi:hypothetical protein [Muricoccus vinaceus]|uniref:Uncharacterized protein n=1 Tax=Muricoccus vinaceus TaxID=424704 RepID=A0ABV6IZM0_9PROT